MIPDHSSVSVDVADGVAVTFDSSCRSDGSRKSNQGREIYRTPCKGIGFETCSQIR